MFLPPRPDRQLVRMNREALMDYIRKHHFDFRCAVRSDRLGHIRKFREIGYAAATKCPSSPIYLQDWTLRHVGDWDDSLPACHEGAFFTRSEFVLRRPKKTYERIFGTMLKCRQPETAFYMERLAQHVFGKGSPHRHADHKNSRVGLSFP
mmetsp:Transcript_16788/g.34180  ORF Transcript_16788/g.34180 Transcript_16788/m.34180 type:complete len:150 (+) Transcript_16788:2-451(+)